MDPQAQQRPCGDGNPFTALRSDDAYWDACPETGAAAASSDDQLAALNALIEAQQLARQRMGEQILQLQHQYLKISSELQSERQRRSAVSSPGGCAEELEALRNELSLERHRSRCQSQEAAASAVALAEARADAQQQRVLADCAVRKLATLRARCLQLEDQRLRLQDEEPERLKRIIVKMLQEVRRLRAASAGATAPSGSCRSADCAAALQLERRNAERLAQEVKRLQLLLAANDAAAEPAASDPAAAVPVPASAPAPSASPAQSAPAAVGKRSDRRSLTSTPTSAGRATVRGPLTQQQQLHRQQKSSIASKNGATTAVKRHSQSAGAALASPARGGGGGSSEMAQGPAATAQDLLDWLAGLPDRFNRQLRALVSPESPTEQVGPALLLDCPVPPPGADLETAGRQVVDWLVRVWNGRLLRIVVASLTRRLPHSAGGTVLYYFVQQLLDTGCPLPAKLRTEFLRQLDGFPGNGRLRQDVHQVKMRVRPIAVTRTLGSAAAAAAASKRNQAGPDSSGPDTSGPNPRQSERAAPARTLATSASASPRRSGAATAASAASRTLAGAGSPSGDAAKSQKARQARQPP